MKKLIERNDLGQLFLNFHGGQIRTWDSKKRFVFMLAGSQGGKTEFAVHWMHREIQNCGDGDYLVVSPSYPLQQKKVMPAYLDFFGTTMGYGSYNKAERIFYMNKRGFNSKIFFGSADKPSSLESATAKAAHLDEVGQKEFRLSSWEAILRRLGIHQGRVLGTTTLYNRGWLKNEIYDKWRNHDPDIDVIQFPSIMNPNYPKKEYERARSTLPTWKFNMFYKGIYDMPAGLIYDSFDDNICKIKPFALNPQWPRYVGHDFGGVNMGTLWYAGERINDDITNYYLYREYLEGDKSIKEHSNKFMGLSEGENIIMRVGGSASEEQWRRDFSEAGWPISKPQTNDVEVGINRVYGLHKQNRIFVFDTCSRYLDEKGSYSRALDENGQPTEKIEDKHSFHLMDAERYLMTRLTRNTGDWASTWSTKEREGSGVPI